MAAKPDTDPMDLPKHLIDAHPDLSPQLQRIAQFVLDHPSAVATQTISDLSDRLGVQPSSFVRLSKAIGFKGFSDVQRIVRARLREDSPGDYFARLKQNKHSADQAIGRFAKLAQSSLETLPAQAELDAAAGIMAGSRIIHIMGQRRAFGIASYLNYMLGQFDASVNLMAFIGGMQEARMSFMDASDCIVAISFPNYTSGAVGVLTSAKDAGLKVIALTDSLVSPIAQLADVTLLTDAQTDAGFRSAVGSTITAQALAVTYGELKGD